MSSLTKLTPHLALAAIFALASGCFSKPKRVHPDDLALESKKGHKGGKPMTMEEVSGYPTSERRTKRLGKKTAPKGAPGVKASEGHLPSAADRNEAWAQELGSQAEPTASVLLPGAPAGTTAPAASAATGASSEVQMGCQELVDKFAASYRKLYAMVPTGTYVPGAAENQALDRMLAAQPADCADSGRRREIVQAISNAVGQHGGKVGVILPLGGNRAKLANFIVQGMRAALQESGKKLEDVIILKDSGGVAKTAEIKLAELVFKDKVAMVMGGLEKPEADVLAAWSKDLQIPVLLLARDRESVNPSPLAFRVYPDEKRLAETLVAAAVKRGLKRVAIVRPDNHKSDKISDYFKKALAAQGGAVAFDLMYTPGNFDSMQGVGRQLFQTEAQERLDEYRKAYKKAQKKAAEEGQPFDPRMVVLKPIVAFDAAFIPDDFRTVRHFAKLFKYHMVDKLPLIGNHEWRSPALVEPWDEFLNGAIFADFIGSYGKLPQQLATETVGSQFFVKPSEVVPTDFKLIGYRAARVLKLAVANAAGQPRRAVAQALPGLASDSPGFLGGGKIFDEGRHANWPTYLFSVAKGEIVLESENQGVSALSANGVVASR